MFFRSSIEQALCDLAPLLGAEGSRPEKEYGEGPDDLWLWSDMSLVIEAKNQNEDSLHKKDAGQLLQSLEWFKKTYSARRDPLPIVVAKVSVCDRNAQFPVNTMVITPKCMRNLLNTVEQFFQKIIAEPLLYSTPQSITNLQESFRLLPEQFVSDHTVKLQKIRV